ncbi:MAG: GNAT family N-acetyltransferase [bacterium]|nr:GNAT family N-acetyltransferase [bacterium]
MKAKSRWSQKATARWSAGVQAHEHHLLQYPRVVEIGGLVVAEHVRGSGVRRQLTTAVVEWGKNRGLSEIIVRSNINRDGTHDFYEGMGFQRVKASCTFSIEIG